MARDCDSLDTHSYHLVSVVEHFGRDGSGHYTVYRRVRTEQEKEFHNGQFAPSLGHWFCISDSQVYSVSEKDVLAAEASLLFYERIVDEWELHLLHLKFVVCYPGKSHFSYNSKKAAISLRTCLEAYGIFTYNNEADTDSEQVVRLNCTP